MELLELFKDPPAKYRGMPFWAWNTKLNPDLLGEQINQFKQMGMGGFYIHPRVGLDTEYLGKSFMDCVKQCVTIARSEGMYCGLYDEDRWPSGYGGGYVTVNPEYRSKGILFTPAKQGSKDYPQPVFDSRAAFTPQGNGTFLAAYRIRLDPDGSLAEYQCCEEDASAGDEFTLWYAYLETAHDSPWFNNQAYLDTLNEEAVRCFIDTVYETYYTHTGADFGGVIPAIFTDEPQFLPKGFLGTAANKQEVLLPFTGDFAETFYGAYQSDILAHLPEILWELPDGQTSVIRYQYHEHLSARFAASYSRQIGIWCDQHNIKLCGHMMEEPTLLSQTKTLGEVMRSLREFAMPGIDMLCDAREYTTAKQAQSIARQYHKTGVVSEIYGVTNWDFDFRRHKLQGDWQAALGITNRVHHLSWMSMAGEAKRDFPATISYQSPWYREYPAIEDHFARLNTILTRGQAIVRVAVIHPVESMWTVFGPARETGNQRSELDERFRQITEWLLFHNIDFDYLAESLIPELWSADHFTGSAYEVILIPGCITLRSTTIAMLKAFRAAGKTVIFLGDIPSLTDAKKSNECHALAAKCRAIPFALLPLMEELIEVRDIDIRYYGEKHLKKPNHKKNWDGERTEKYIYQMREEEDCRWLFIANARPQENPDRLCEDHLEIKIKGRWQLEKYNTLTGEISQVSVAIIGNNTILHEILFDHDSLLLKLTACKPGQKTDSVPAAIPAVPSVIAVSDDLEEQSLFQHPVQLYREEPNVLLLDIAEYSLDGIHWQTDEILRIDSKVRTELGYPLRVAAHAQPWTIKETRRSSRTLYLKYFVTCETEIKNLTFAAEELEQTTICLDGKEVTQVDSGYYVDQAIRKIKFPDLSSGSHEILLTISFDEKTNLEASYLCGDFHVQLNGCKATLMTESPAAGWTSLTRQGMPFYGGNAIYQTICDLEEGSYELILSKFRAPLLTVKIDGKAIGRIIFSPYRLPFQINESGSHTLEITTYGSRINTFGAIHDCDEKEVYFDSNAWRTTAEDWAYEYQLKETGILKAPSIRKVERG